MTSTLTLERPAPRTTIDYAARAAELVPLLRQQAGAIEAARELTVPVLDALVERNLFQVLLAPLRDEGDATMTGAMHVLETLAGGDASTAWDVMAAMGGALISAFLPAATVDRMFASPRDVAATAVGRIGRAVAVEGGYLVEAKWPFLSGSPHASWIGGLCMVFDGEIPRMLDGNPTIVVPLIRKERVTLLDTWYATGLCGTGSHEAEVNSVFVPADEVAHFANGVRPGLPFFYMIEEDLGAPLAGAAVAVGIAQGALDSYREIIQDRLLASGEPAAEAPLPRLAAVEAETAIAQARAHIYQLGAEVDAQISAGILPAHGAVRLASLAATSTVERCIDAISTLYRAAGTASVFTGRPLDRALRDILTLGAHRMFQRQNYILHG